MVTRVLWRVGHVLGRAHAAAASAGRGCLVGWDPGFARAFAAVAARGVPCMLR